VKAQPAHPSDEVRPGDDFNQRGNHASLLEKHGWTFIYQRIDGTELWRRPGKNESWSGTWGCVRDRFYVFSTNASPLEAERTYDLFSLYTCLEHGGDFAAAARALAAQGFGTQKTQPGSVKNTEAPKQDDKIRGDKRGPHLLFLAKRYHQQGLRRKEILALLQKENEDKCEPRLSEAEVNSILDRVLPRLQTITAAELLDMDIPEPKWAIPNFVPEGLTILAGRPKVGKSWLALSFCASVAVGGYVMGKIQVEQGEALFIGLEDNYRRLQDRLFQLCENQKPSNLHLLLDLPKLDKGGLDILGDWLDEHPGVRLVVIDTLEKIKPQNRRRASNIYSEDYDFTGTLQKFALSRGIALLVVHHTRKMQADYLVDELSGTTGISAGADCILMLRQKLDGHVLYRTGRDVEEGDFAVRRDKDVGWLLLGDAKEFAVSEQRRAIIEVLRETDEPMAPKDIAEALQRESGNIRFLLSQMVRDGTINRLNRGKYVLDKITNNANIANNANNTNNANNPILLANVSDTKNTANNCEATPPQALEATCEFVSDVSNFGQQRTNNPEKEIAQKNDETAEASQDGDYSFLDANIKKGEVSEDVSGLLVEDEKIANNQTHNANISTEIEGWISQLELALSEGEYPCEPVVVPGKQFETITDFAKCVRRQISYYRSWADNQGCYDYSRILANGIHDLVCIIEQYKRAEAERQALEIVLNRRETHGHTNRD
jgi:hypothetical protein